MNKLGVSQEYIGALVIVLISLLKVFNIEIGSDVVTAIVTGLVGIWVAYRRYQKGDISLGGVRRG